MTRCLELARKAAGQTAPNPMVGSVILKDDLVVGEGFHPGAGQPHAEVFALKQAGDKAYGATLYVNLEPCKSLWSYSSLHRSDYSGRCCPGGGGHRGSRLQGGG